MNFHKIQNFICIQASYRPNFKKPESKHTFMMFTQKWGGEWVLKNCHVFADFIILNIRSIVHFCGWWKWEGHLLVIFCGRHIWVTSKTIIIQKKNKFNYKTNRNLIISPLTQISRTTPLIWHLLFQSQQWKRQNNVWNMFKVNNNKDARTRSITSS